MKYLLAFFFLIQASISYSQLTDTILNESDGQLYAIVKIGDQWWMGKNLKATKYTDGTDIPFIEDALDWDALSAAGRAYCWYGNNNSSRDTYGGFYTSAAAMNGALSSNINPSGIQGVCPDGGTCQVM